MVQVVQLVFSCEVEIFFLAVFESVRHEHQQQNVINFVPHGWGQRQVDELEWLERQIFCKRKSRYAIHAHLKTHAIIGVDSRPHEGLPFGAVVDVTNDVIITPCPGILMIDEMSVLLGAKQRLQLGTKWKIKNPLLGKQGNKTNFVTVCHGV